MTVRFNKAVWRCTGANFKQLRQSLVSVWRAYHFTARVTSRRPLSPMTLFLIRLSIRRNCHDTHTCAGDVNGDEMTPTLIFSMIQWLMSHVAVDIKHFFDLRSQSARLHQHLLRHSPFGCPRKTLTGELFFFCFAL